MKQHSSSEAHSELLRQLDEADLKAAYHTGHPGPHSLNGRAAIAIRALLSATQQSEPCNMDVIVFHERYEHLLACEAATLPQPATQRSEPSDILELAVFWSRMPSGATDALNNAGACRLARAYLDALDVINAAPLSETPPSGTAKVPEGWIPVGTSDVPPEGHHVLVYTFWDKCIWTAYTQNGKWHHANGDGSNKYVLQRVVAWMELPPSPDGNDNETGGAR
jgi:hypothetical protein